MQCGLAAAAIQRFHYDRSFSGHYPDVCPSWLGKPEENLRYYVGAATPPQDAGVERYRPP